MIEKVNALIKVNAIRKGILITDHNYENVIAISTKLILMRLNYITLKVKKKSYR
jgi:ABC-type lipopolysaccharide export system ATPase subunit